ncbi:hypothetical protein PIB30_014024 [Stylosanthes scabra]|uniref:Uncharacterized protein n=1 Tax=Stylosanthes scabra TaxID=79078 RepID=A0ABU6Z3E6_9FABA|nr:hypothetical protein [Stylosanthes scabra]
MVKGSSIYRCWNGPMRTHGGFICVRIGAEISNWACRPRSDACAWLHVMRTHRLQQWPSRMDNGRKPKRKRIMTLSQMESQKSPIKKDGSITSNIEFRSAHALVKQYQIRREHVLATCAFGRKKVAEKKNKLQATKKSPISEDGGQRKLPMKKNKTTNEDEGQSKMPKKNMAIIENEDQSKMPKKNMTINEDKGQSKMPT